ncbi:hypothetical protein ACPPVU_17845 [Mucilaginibacter sp. McL0603]|uniref:hypothetical protein n=1 Tax=Mucilaginibacter sp. McL0603 TaxID=3415670 RepID=UPI003CF27208
MMRNYKSVISFIACLMICINSKAQVLSGLQNNFINFQKANLHEKIYVHTDKNFYLTGEILWFKIYNTDGSTNKIIDLSKVAYVEILDNKHNAVLQAKIALNQGTGTGSFYIPFSLTNGNYQLRAYTSWMKNFDVDYFFEKQITIVNPVKVSPAQPKSVSSVYDVQFFPEGGHLVKGLNSKIALKVTTPDGKGADCTGAIINQQNDTVVRFKSLKFGIGSFSFTPLAQTGYKVIIKTGGTIITKELPEISNQGYVMQVTDHGADWEVSVKNSDSTRTSVVYSIVHNRHTINLAESASITNGSAHFNINKNKLSEGLSYITLFDGQQRPICERLIFKRPNRKLVISANTDNKLYDNRKKVSLSITTRNKDNKNIPANLSLSVYRLDSLQNNDAAHIAGYLWLSADLKGHIESPDYYIENNNEETNQAIDNVLLSQGWTQFDWSKILAGEKPRFTFLPEYTGPIITGKIVNSKTEQPANNITAYVTIAGTRHQLYTAKSDSTGKLLFNTRDFYGSNELFAQTQWQQDSIYRIDIVNPFSEQYGQQTMPLLNLNTGTKKLLADNSLNMQVQNIFTAKQLKQFNNPAADTALFYGKPTYTYLLDDYTRFPTIEDVIHEYVRLVVMTRDRGKTGLQIINNDKTTLPGQPLVLLDARPIFDVDKIFTVDPLKVKRLDVVGTNYVYGPAVFNGIISFITYNGQSTNIQLDQHTIVMDYDGLQLERKFYSPVYDSDQQINSSIPDFRNVLYWNPKADTDPQGQNKLSFFTGDKPGHYIGIIEGIAQNGEAGSQYFYFEVKSK